MNKQDLTDFIHTLTDYHSDFMYSDSPTEDTVQVDVDGYEDGVPYTWEYVDSYGGEGMGDDYWAVYKFTDVTTNESLYVKFDGYYASYNGADFNEWFFVEPKEVTVVQYVRAA